MVVYIVIKCIERSYVSRPISWGEMDLFGHLNNVHYFRYLEDARIGFLKEINFFDLQLYCVILKNECDYKQPVVYPDTLITTSYVTHVGNTSFTMCYVMKSQQQDCVVALGKSVMVIVDPKTFQKQSIPVHARETLTAYMREFPYDKS